MSRQKKRSEQRKQKAVSKTFSIGDSVKVRPGVRCPDDDSFSIAGWQGRVFEIDEDEELIGIRWDSVTLREMPTRYTEESEREGQDWGEMYLEAGDVESASPRDGEDEADVVREELESRCRWLDGTEQGERISAVVADVEQGEQLRAWAAHLRKSLTFPFDAKVAEYQERGRLRQGDKVRILGLDETDEFIGVLVGIARGKERFVFPLCDLEVPTRKSPNRQSVSDYCVWFANR